MNIGFVAHQEILNINLREKQKQVIEQINQIIVDLTQARIDFFPQQVDLKTDEEVANKINSLLELKKQCTTLQSFVMVETSVLDGFEIRYTEDRDILKQLKSMFY